MSYNVKPATPVSTALSSCLGIGMIYADASFFFQGTHKVRDELQLYNCVG